MQQEREDLKSSASSKDRIVCIVGQANLWTTEMV